MPFKGNFSTLNQEFSTVAFTIPLTHKLPGGGANGFTFRRLQSALRADWEFLYWNTLSMLDSKALSLLIPFEYFFEWIYFLKCFFEWFKLLRDFFNTFLVVRPSATTPSYPTAFIINISLCKVKYIWVPFWVLFWVNLLFLSNFLT